MLERRRRRRRLEEDADAIFAAEATEDYDLPPEHEPVSEDHHGWDFDAMRQQELDELCERLFHGLPCDQSDGNDHGPEHAVATIIATRTVLPTTKMRHATCRRESRGRALSLRSILALTATLLLAAIFTFQGLNANRSLTKPIEALRPGDKVLTNAPVAALLADGQAPGENTASEQLDPAQHRLVILRADVPWPDGTIDDYHIQTIQHVSWLTEHRIQVGGMSPIPLDLQEMESSDDLAARVVDIRPCPPIQSGPGRVVLTTVNHLNRDGLEFTLRDSSGRDSSGREEQLRPTGRHRFYSATRDTWLPAQDLRSGETLDGLTGPITVTAINRIPGTHRVYNLTVQGEHVYRVATSGVLVHNSYSVNQMNKQILRGKAPKTIERIDKAKAFMEQDHVHFVGDHALNADGIWKHGGKALSNAEIEWLTAMGWPL